MNVVFELVYLDIVSSRWKRALYRGKRALFGVVHTKSHRHYIEVALFEVALHSVPSYKKRSYKKRLVDIVRHKKRLYKDTEKIRNTSV